MKTPFDAALRVLRQELDNIRVQTARKTEEVEQINEACEAVSEEMKAEADLARECMPFMNYALFAERKRLEARLLEQRHETAQSELEGLMESTHEAFGSYKTLDEAANRWEEKQAREESRREQNATDEIATQTFHRARAA